MKKTMIKVSTYARQIGKTRATIYSYIKKGELPFTKVDGVLFVIIK